MVGVRACQSALWRRRGMEEPRRVHLDPTGQLRASPGYRQSREPPMLMASILSFSWAVRFQLPVSPGALYSY